MKTNPLKALVYIIIGLIVLMIIVQVAAWVFGLVAVVIKMVFGFLLLALACVVVYYIIRGIFANK